MEEVQCGYGLELAMKAFGYRVENAVFDLVDDSLETCSSDARG